MLDVYRRLLNDDHELEDGDDEIVVNAHYRFGYRILYKCTLHFTS